MKRKIKKIFFLLILVLVISLFLYLRLKSYTYEVNYNLNDFKITETYNKETSIYKFFINHDGITYPYAFENKYIRKKELIKNIKVYSNDLETCILPISDNIEFYPICDNTNNLQMYNLSKIDNIDFKYKKIKSVKNEYDKLKINFLNDLSFLLYNYKGFYYIKDKKIDNIQLFNKDVYSLNLIYEYNQYIIVPDYNEEYYFNKFYIINMLNGDVEELTFKYNISFDSVFLGSYKNYIYILDKKEQQEYKINLKKLKIEQSDFLILKNQRLEKTNYKNIVNNNLIFDNEKISNYKIIDNKLFQIVDNYQILITDKKVNKIIKEMNNTIYYLIDENLYMYNNTYGEVLLISNFEWNFNNTNMIYLNK